MKQRKKKITPEQIEKMELNEDDRISAIVEMVEDYLSTVDDEIYWKRKEAALHIMVMAANYGGETFFESLGILDEAKSRFREIWYESQNDDEDEE
jgi:hypothetical protein